MQEFTLYIANRSVNFKEQRSGTMPLAELLIKIELMRYVPYSGRHRAYPEWEMYSVDLTEDIIKFSDCIIIATDHSCIDYEWLKEKAKLIVDTRNCITGKLDNVVKA